jgi:UDP:flavonoid glycosyltransferase YjiC (YdhE family)
LSNPIEKQFEQILNASYINKLGFGVRVDKISKEAIESFIENIPCYKENLSKISQKDNSVAFAQIDKKIKEYMDK